MSVSENQISSYELNQELYNSALEIKNELSLIEERLKKMEEHKQEVSDAVYKKVKSDYLVKKDGVKKTFEEKRKEIKKVLVELYKEKKGQETELQKHREVIEEAKFRTILGEISEKEKEEIEHTESEKIQKYEQLLGKLQESVAAYEELAGGAVEVPSEKPASVSSNSKKTVQKEKVEPVVEEVESDYFLESSEGDYFAENGESFEGEESISEILRNIPEDKVAEVSSQDQDEVTGQIDTGIDEDFEGERGGAKFICQEGEMDPPEIELGETTSIGRSPTNDIVLKEAKISRQHAVIHLREEGYVIVDLKSANGFYINGEKKEEHLLQDGDEVTLGSYRFLFQG